MSNGNEINKQLNQNSGQKRDSKFEKASQSILGGDFLTRTGAVRLLPFLLFLTFLGIIYIANIYYAEKDIRELDQLGREVKELKYEYITNKSTLMHISKQSEVAKRLKSTGLKESVIPPYRLEKPKKD